MLEGKLKLPDQNLNDLLKPLVDLIDHLLQHNLSLFPQNNFDEANQNRQTDFLPFGVTISYAAACSNLSPNTISSSYEAGKLSDDVYRQIEIVASSHPSITTDHLSSSSSVGSILTVKRVYEILAKLNPLVQSLSRHFTTMPSVGTAAVALFLLVIASTAGAQLSHKYYSTTCPGLQPLVRRIIDQALSQDPTLGAALLRLFFHDCFGCDASVLLDDTATFAGEKNAAPNMNSLRGFQVIDAIKSSVEAKCRQTVSCADILALAARDSVAALGGPYWAVYLGRRDSRTASQREAVANLPPPGASLSTMVSSFGAKGLAAWDTIALSGAHTIGQARCANFRQHIYNDTDVDPGFAGVRQLACPASGGDSITAPLDVQTPMVFDNDYYRNLVARKGLLHSDQQLFNGGQYDYLVSLYSTNQTAFFDDFATAMVKMGDMSPLTGSVGEIRTNCRRWN
ncbi:hypothetical protein ZIOFF_035282 [Zingiber officinale]|uniref:peroxidase n=1 Tax=Zingiber officinale TaxID=94328 RepID=A0A8J5GK47_ZINOF|nr:hypothetical protein ZIOFF_035282 [Zingiber officinale]